MNRKIKLAIGVIGFSMLAVAIVFFIVALYNPQAGFPMDISVGQSWVLYCAYLMVMCFCILVSVIP